jgi:hypothetical protein
MTRRPDSKAVRWAIPILLVIACAGAALVSGQAAGVPTVALGNHVVFALQLTLVFFYGSLLLLVPLVRALDGDLPIELSLKGARWTDGFQGLGEDVLAWRREAIESEFQSGVGIRTEVQVLREDLGEMEEVQELVLDQVLGRLAEIEEKVMSRESRG